LQTSTLPQQAPIAVSGTDGDEASRLAAFFGSTNEQWKNTQEQMQKYVLLLLGCKSIYCANAYLVTSASHLSTSAEEAEVLEVRVRRSTVMYRTSQSRLDMSAIDAVKEVR
jgi:hypothetical protein